MCGIGGTTASDEAGLWKMTSWLGHRGPDDRGIWQERPGGVGLAHTRLAVIDLSADGHQPMSSECGRYVIAYNGEIYNYRPLREELEAAGEVFNSASDTEVVLKLLRRDGLTALDKLAGMFAIAFFDRHKRELLLCRDRFGKKPLVYALLPDGQLAFASEITALRRLTGVDLTLDREALSGYLACLYIPAPRTIYRGIRKLPPGGWLRWRSEGIETGQWWRPSIGGEREISTDEAAEELLPVLRRAVTDRLVGDVAVGCFLSGGLDSSIIACLMAEERRRLGAEPVQTFTMAFAEAAYDESHEAAQIARHLGTNHTVLSSSARLTSMLGDMIDAFGEPFGNPTALLVGDLSRKARQHVTVALAGDGGDEVFAGYPRYKGGILAGKMRRLPHFLRHHLMAPAATLIPESSEGHHAFRRAREFLSSVSFDEATAYASWVEYFDPEERRQLLGLDSPPYRPIARIYAQSTSRDPLDAMQETDLRSFLPGNILAYADAMSMRHALELRAPMLDHRLVEAVGRIAPSTRFHQGPKTLLKAIGRHLLPREIIDRPKRGFNPPMGIWIKRELASAVAERLRPQRLARLGIDAAPVARLVSEHGRGRDHGLKIWALLVLDAWADRQAASDDTGVSVSTPS